MGGRLYLRLVSEEWIGAPIIIAAHMAAEDGFTNKSGLCCLLFREKAWLSLPAQVTSLLEER